MELPWFLLFMTLTFTAVDAECGLGSSLSVTLDEGASMGDAVYNFTVTEDIWLASEPNGGYFSISNNTLYAEKDLDMSKDEYLCNNRVISLSVECESIATSPVTFIVNMNPIDRHPPQFPYPEFNHTIPETTGIGTEVFDFSRSDETSAVDKDCAHATLYYLMSSNPYLHFGDVIKGTVFTITTFDYESGQNSHSVIVNATSGGIMGTAKFTLNISDVDDEDPIFTNDTFILEVEEEKNDTRPRTSTPPVHAFDQDLGINTPLAYRIRMSSPPLDHLTINNDTGLLSLGQKLDRETHPTYTVILEAGQLDNKRRTATATLSILVQDINDNRPSFDPTTYTASIQEHSVDGTNIISVTARDGDKDPNNLFNYTLVPESDVFNIDPQTGYLQVRNSTLLDRETHSTFTVTVNATELIAPASGSPSCMADCTATVHITLLDINDHSPVFVGAPYSFSSNNEAAEQIGTVTATDEDIGDNGRVTYSIQHSDFSVNETTGSITQVNPVANQREEVFLVQACDNGQSSRCSSELITVTFPDQNVTSSKRTVNVTENVAAGTIVYTIPIAYSGYRLQLTTHMNTFKIVEQDHVQQVVTAADIDRENTTSYTLVIDVMTGTTIEANITLHVVVLDVNDNAPIFNMSDYSFSVSVDAKIGDVLGVVRAYDLDEGINGVVTFGIQGTESSMQFDIEGNTGTITFKIVPESPTEVLVVATDGGVFPLKTTTAVEVVIAGAQNAYAMFHAPAEKGDIEKDKDSLAGQISAILNISIDIGNIQSADVDNGASSYFRLTAKEATVHRDDLTAKVNSNYDRVLALFSPYQNKSEEVFTTPFIALLAAAIVVAVISVIVIIVIVHINRKRHRHHERLVRNLSKQGTIYETQAVEEETVGDRQSVHSQTGSTQELLGAAQQPNGDAVPVVNEGFVEDDNNNDNRAGDENQDTVTQYTHIEEEAERREITEGVIVDLSSEETPEPEHVETQSHPNPDYGDGEEEIANPDYAVVVKEKEPETQTALMSIEDEDVDQDDEKDETVPSHEADPILEPLQEPNIPPPRDIHDEDPRDVEDEAPADVYENEAVEDDEDSSDGFPPPPPTPPRVRKSDPEDEEPYEAEDEPEPDYAKKVRFSEVRVQVIPDPKDEDAVESDVVGGGTEGAETDEEDHTTKSDRPFEEIQNPAEDIDEDDGTFIMTSL
ncbi:cadherin-23-like [Haliotis rubra]|uniref:cadherin-23-like n=1 Tax=Haliotis rubra TaxID=36100 RepID=UPI001EE51254|nr:cadherin-23-like [Haliotis rubra]XP_046583348.1 cadherin-23-like [Haliotis rubra]XP_046583349.1 cadherin-23-like [Haliotis rubra]XP_046583350.1 cadherin-23-like [Haliotis rubra]